MSEKTITTEEQTTTGKIIGLASIPAAAVTGTIYLDSSTNNKLYDTLKGRKKLEGLEPLKRNFEGNVSVDGTTKFTAIETANETRKFNFKFGEDYEARLKELGFKNFKDRFVKGLHPDQRKEVVMIAITAASIALGAFLMVAQSKLFMKKTEIDTPQGNEPTR